MENDEKSGEDWISEANAELQRRYDLIQGAGGPISSLTLGIKPPLHAREAEYFVRGLEAGLFSIDDESYVQSTMLPASSRTSSRNKILQLFWRRAGQRYLFREGICQLSTVATLRLNYNWPEDKIKMEPTFPEHPHLPWAVDILLTDTRATVALCEVKRDKRELDQLVTGFQHCCGRGQHTRQKCEFGKNHPKYALCAALRPKYFVAVSPGEEVCFQLSYHSGVIEVAKVDLSCLAWPT